MRHVVSALTHNVLTNISTSRIHYVVLVVWRSGTIRREIYYIIGAMVLKNSIVLASLYWRASSR